jgi:hypothetical protein
MFGKDFSDRMTVHLEPFITRSLNVCIENREMMGLKRHLHISAEMNETG